MTGKGQLIKDGYLRAIAYNDLPPHSWQRERHEAGWPFYEQVVQPLKVMAKIEKLAAAEQARSANMLGTVATGECQAPTELPLVA